MPSCATVTVADILELRADGLSEEEIWSLLCQAVQTLQDLFLSGDIIGRPVVPLVSPHTLAISSKGRVVMSLASQIHPRDECFLAPEYKTRVEASDSPDWEKMWVYSLGRSLLSSLKITSTARKNLTVLKSMTEEEPTRRASLMSLLNTISEHCKTSLPPKPFSHLVTEMYREVFGTPPQCLLPPERPHPDEGPEDSVPRVSADRLGADGSFPAPEKKSVSRASSAGGSSESSRRSAAARRNPVQRAPSRLYRGPSGRDSKSEGGGEPSRPGTCVGPEFVVRGTEPQKVVHLGDAKGSGRRALTVVLLTGQRVRVACEPRTAAGKLFEILVRVERLEDDYLFGLACAIGGDFVFVPSETKLHEVAPSGWKDGGSRSPFFLYLRVKFFLPSLRGVKSTETRHLVYLQLRRSLLEQQIRCELHELSALGGLALQAEFGNFEEEEHGTCSYFLLEHYLPEELIDERAELEERLQEHHRARFGLDPGRAEEIFVARVQRLPEYGSHHYTASWVRKSASIPMWVTVNPQGVYLYEKKKSVLDRKIHEAFVWKNIQGLTCNENYFRLVPRDVFGHKVAGYKLRLDDKKSFFLFRLASFHHQFFLKLRIELSPLHALSREFGVSVKKEGKSVFYLEKKAGGEGERGQRGERRPPASCRDAEERQNKENENPMGEKAERREKRPGVKMGVRAFHPPPAGDASLDAYVIDSSVRSPDERFSYDLHESIPANLAERIDDASWQEERILRKIHLTKDKYGSFGLEIVEGNNGGLFVENVLTARRGDEPDSIRKGDQLLSANGVCLLDLNYSEALAVLKNSGDRMLVLVARSLAGDAGRRPIEHEYLKNIRHETANEADGSESEAEPRTGRPFHSPFALRRGL